MMEHRIAGRGRAVSEKTLELNVCAELLQLIRTWPGCEGALWFGLTQKQERRTGLDQLIENVGPGFALMLQFKSPWPTSIVDHLYKFSINEQQHEPLDELAAEYPESVFYVFPLYSTWNKAQTDAPDLCQDTWLLPVASVPLDDLRDISRPLTGVHRVELERVDTNVVATVHSPRVIGETINAGEYFSGLASTLSGGAPRALVPHSRLRDWVQRWDQESIARSSISPGDPGDSDESTRFVRFRSLNAMYIPFAP